jgi:hypothetical protein
MMIPTVPDGAGPEGKTLPASCVVPKPTGMCEKVLWGSRLDTTPVKE